MSISRFSSSEVTRVVCAFLCVVCSGCVDPLREKTLADLGPEVSGVPVGPLHRAGQPCLVCHDGTISTPFAIGGTIYLEEDGARPAVSALIDLADGLGNQYRVATNCAGNFFVRPGDFDPAWPLWVRIEHEGWAQEMESPVNENGSCASCHAPTKSAKSPGPVYVFPFASEPRETNCQ